jgi:hypothetical protein
MPTNPLCDTAAFSRAAAAPYPILVSFATRLKFKRNPNEIENPKLGLLIYRQSTSPRSNGTYRLPYDSEGLMKSLTALFLIGTVVGIVPALAQTSTSTSTSTTTPTSDGSRTTTTWSDGSSETTTTSGSKSTTTYQAPGTGYQPMGRSGYNPMGSGN